MIAGPLANLLLAVILLTGYFAFGGYETTRIARIAENSLPPRRDAKGDRIVSYGGRGHISRWM